LQSKLNPSQFVFFLTSGIACFLTSLAFQIATSGYKYSLTQNTYIVAKFTFCSFLQQYLHIKTLNYFEMRFLKYELVC